jgi:hypothetical protein
MIMKTDNSGFRSLESLNFEPPKTLAMAMAEIQQYYLIEKKAALDKNTFTIEHFSAFSRAATRSAFVDMMFMIVGAVIGMVIYYAQHSFVTDQTTQVFFWHIQGSPLLVAEKFASYGGILYSTSICCWMARLSIGNFCRRAVNTIYMTRLMILLSMSLLSFFVFGLFSKGILSQQRVYTFCAFFAKRSPQFANNLYNFLWNYCRGMLFESGILILVAAVVAIAIPYFLKGAFHFFTPKDEELRFKD